MNKNNLDDNDIRFAVENGRIKFTPEHQRIYDELKAKYGTHSKAVQPKTTDTNVSPKTPQQNSYIEQYDERYEKWRSDKIKKYGSIERYREIDKRRTEAKIKAVKVVGIASVILMYIAYIIYITTSYHEPVVNSFGQGAWMILGFALYVITCVFASVLVLFVAMLISACIACMLGVADQLPEDYGEGLAYTALFGVIAPAIITLVV